MVESKSEKQSIINAVKQLEKNEIKESTISIDFEYLTGLNDAQKIAATRLEGNYLVIAGPGAGKTHTLVYRAVHLIRSGVSANELCIVTFTRKAANQLKYRIKKMIPGIELGFIGTIHSLAYTLINRGVNSETRLIDPEDDLMVLKLVIAEEKLNKPPRVQLRTIRRIFDYMSLTMKSIKEVLIDLNKEQIDAINLMEIYKSYTNYKKRNGYITYSDCLKLATNADRGNLKYLIIDEFQDTDPLQLSMLKSLDFPNVMAIGDDFQSIYSFRGADNTIILKFGKHFENSQVIKLNINYRSTKEIVALENYVTNTSDYGYKKDLISYKGKSGNEVQYFDPRSNRKDFIMKRILKYNKNPSNQSLAVIYRFNRRKSEIESDLIQNKVDYVVYGGIRLLERKHIKDLFALLLVNKNKNDFIPYLRALTLIDGVGEVTAKKLIENNMQSQKTGVLNLRNILFKEYDNISDIIIDSMNFYFTLELVLKKSNYTKEEIEEDFNLIKEIGENYESIPNFISDIILDSNQDKWSNKQKTGKIVLTTIHSSKGLEFDEVHFIYDAEREFSFSKQEENRRLFYTAISRAKSYLFIYDSWGRSNIKEIIADFQTDFLDDSYIQNINISIDINKGREKVNSKNIQKKQKSNFDFPNVKLKSKPKKKKTKENSIKKIIKKITSFFN